MKGSSKENMKRDIKLINSPAKQPNTLNIMCKKLRLCNMKIVDSSREINNSDSFIESIAH